MIRPRAGMCNRNCEKKLVFCQKISQGAIFMTEEPGLYLYMHYCFEGGMEYNNDDDRPK